MPPDRNYEWVSDPYRSYDAERSFSRVASEEWEGRRLLVEVVQLPDYPDEDQR